MTVSDGALHFPGFTPKYTKGRRTGYYSDGIRIEIVAVVREAQPNNFGDKGFLGFQHVFACLRTPPLSWTREGAHWAQAY
jgi:hypothetical protein